MIVRYSKTSRADLIAVFVYVAERFGFERATRTLYDIATRCEALGDAPFVGRESTMRPGMRTVIVAPNVIYYRIDKRAVRILRIVDGRRNASKLFK